MKDVEKIDYISFALVIAISSTIITAIIGLLMLILSLSIISSLPGIATSTLFGITTASLITSYIIIIIIGFIGGFISGIITAAIYNFFLHKYIKIKAE